MAQGGEVYVVGRGQEEARGGFGSRAWWVLAAVQQQGTGSDQRSTHEAALKPPHAPILCPPLCLLGSHHLLQSLSPPASWRRCCAPPHAPSVAAHPCSHSNESQASVDRLRMWASWELGGYKGLAGQGVAAQASHAAPCRSGRTERGSSRPRCPPPCVLTLCGICCSLAEQF